MKKLDLSQTVTILANVGVIAGILFLGYELQQNNQFLAAQARSNMTSHRISFNAMLLVPEIASVIVKAQNDEALSAVESFLLERVKTGLFVRWEAEYREYKEGMYGEEELPVMGYRRVFAFIPGLLDGWQRNKAIRDPDFVEFIEENVLNEL